MDVLSHVDREGNFSMVDVSGKHVERRTARAAGRITLARETLALVQENQIKKGDVLAAARLAGIFAAKQTAALIPLCHPLLLDRVDVQLRLLPDAIEASSEVVCTGRTGAEMEALMAVNVALLTIYDMCKAVDKKMEIAGVRLIEKHKEPLEPGGA